MSWSRSVATISRLYLGVGTRYQQVVNMTETSNPNNNTHQIKEQGHGQCVMTSFCVTLLKC